MNGGILLKKKLKLYKTYNKRMQTKELKFELLEEKVIREMEEEKERRDSYFDSSNILLYYKNLRDKLLNIKPKNLKDLYESDYSYILNNLKTKLNSAKKLIEPSSYKDEKIHDLEQEIEDFKKLYKKESFLKSFDYEMETEFTDEEKQKILEGSFFKIIIKLKQDLQKKKNEK